MEENLNDIDHRKKQRCPKEYANKVKTEAERAENERSL